MKHVLITGAGRGLGLALTELALAKGAVVFATVRKMNAQISDLQQLYSDQLIILQFDVRDEAAIEQAAKKLTQKEKHLDVMINNAALLNERNKTIEELDINASLEAIDINTFGPIRMIKHFLPLLRKGTNPSIINISSDSGRLTKTYVHDYPYGLSKLALNMLTEKLNIYLRDDHIQVLSVHPGWMHTDMGGQQAPIDPNEAAKGIYQLIDQRITVSEGCQFVDYEGNIMDI
ncbi:SDR family oxidoreductase [Amphibacillus sediminis]|uniref:SDR family oxidoreductase n=1 Tax=Amphibacillus sediminis TaxID=360185 RepID=UPI000834114E|nr:SDR family oxidoreductase [Amphibacillus sediminis]